MHWLAALVAAKATGKETGELVVLKAIEPGPAVFIRSTSTVVEGSIKPTHAPI